MLSLRRFPTAFLIIALCLALVGPAIGQSRIGDSHSWSPVRAFRSDSFGVNNLPSSTPASGGGVLGSSIYSGGPPRGSTRSGAGSGDHRGGSTQISGGMRQVQVTHPVTPLTITVPTTGGASLTPAADDPTTTQVRSLTTTLGQSAAEGTTVTQPRLTSLAPHDPGAYQAEMLKGEAALKAKDYAKALEAFEAALPASNGAPEVQLSLAQTYLAMADGDYKEPAIFLARTLNIFPALALANVHPQDFLASGEYDRVLTALEDHLQADPDDHIAEFVLGYLRWRDGQATDAIKLLNAAVVNSEIEELTRAIDMLLKSIGGFRHALAADAPDMQPAADYAWAGVRLALPVDFKQERLTRINEVMVAANESKDSLQQVGLSVYPIGQPIGLEALMDSLTEHLNRQLGVTNVTVDGEAEVTFHVDQRAFVRTFSCTYQGQRVVAGRLCFLREVTTPLGKKVHLAYSLGMGVQEAHADKLLPVMAAIARSLEMIDFQRPIDLPVPTEGRIILDRNLGYEIRQPAGWVGSRTQDGYSMGQFDCLLGGKVSPRVEVIFAPADGDQSPESFGQQALEASAAKGVRKTILSQGPAMLAGREGYQFTLRKESGDPNDAEADPHWIEVARLIIVPRGQGRQVVALVARCRQAEVEQAQKVLESFAESFKLLEK